MRSFLIEIPEDAYRWFWILNKNICVEKFMLTFPQRIWVRVSVIVDPVGKKIARVKKHSFQPPLLPYRWKAIVEVLQGFLRFQAQTILPHLLSREKRAFQALLLRYRAKWFLFLKARFSRNAARLVGCERPSTITTEGFERRNEMGIS